MKNKYLLFKEEYSKLLNEIKEQGSFVAFNEEQYEEKIKEIEEKGEDPKDYHYRAFGMYMSNQCYEDFKKVLESKRKKCLEYMVTVEDFAYDMFKYHMFNKEYAVLEDDEEIISATGLDEEIFEDKNFGEKLKKEYNRARKYVLENTQF